VLAAKNPLLDNWPITLFVPAALVLIGVLALVTRMMDHKDEQAREAVRHEAAGHEEPSPHAAP